jgi:hypothetical protein
MTNLNAKNFISLYVTRTNSLNNAIFKDLENGKDSHTYKACVELTTLSNAELYEIGYKSLFEFTINKKGNKDLIKKRIYRNETTAYKSIIENIDKIVEFSKTKDAKLCKVNKLRGVMDKTNAYFRPKTKKTLKKSQVVTSNKQDENIKDTFLSASEFIELANVQEFTKSDIEKIILGLQKLHSETKKVA